jgi:hypothetical protein
MRFCIHCRESISLEVLVRGRWKAIFCSQSCRDADKVAIRSRKRESRKEKGLCPTCGRKSAASRGTKQARNAVDVGTGEQSGGECLDRRQFSGITSST